MIILHAAPISWDVVSGHGAVVPELASAQNRLDGVEAGLAVTVSNYSEPTSIEFPLFDAGGLRVWRRRLALPEPFDRPDVVIFHSTYVPRQARIARRLRRARIPYIICPHGGMTRGALGHKRLKKRFGNILFFGRMVAGAAAIHCLTDREAASTRSWNRPTFVVGNGVRLPPESELATPGESPRRRFVFIGRVAVSHKGLDLLVKACARIRPQLEARGAEIEIYGPDFEGDGKRLTALIGSLGLDNLISWRGPVLGDVKGSVLKGTDVFLHTSRYEGHPMAVLEALSFGVPCLVTPGTNMAQELAAHQAGWVAEPTAAGIAQALEEILEAEAAQLQAAGVRARKMAEQDYRWEEIASRTVEAYRKFVV